MDKGSLLNHRSNDKVYLLINLSSDLCHSTASVFPEYQKAHNALCASRATVRWIASKELLASLEYWRLGDDYGYAYGIFLSYLVTGDLPCPGYQGSRYEEHA